jgi:hypothetical protein
MDASSHGLFMVPSQHISVCTVSKGLPHKIRFS